MSDDNVEVLYDEPSNGDGYKNNNTPLSVSDFGALIPKTDIQYTPIELKTVQLDLSIKAEKLIEKVIDVYYKSDESSPEINSYLQALKTSEATSYKQLLFQTKAMEHMVQSLLERLNSAGSMDNGLYKLLLEVIRESSILTMQVSNYVRNLPQTFKTLKYELETNIDMVHVEKTDEMFAEEVNENPDDFIKKPQRGMREMLKLAEEAMIENHEKNSEALNDNSNIPTSLSNDTDDENDINISEEDLIKKMQQEMNDDDDE